MFVLALLLVILLIAPSTIVGTMKLTTVVVIVVEPSTEGIVMVSPELLGSKLLPIASALSIPLPLVERKSKRAVAALSWLVMIREVAIRAGLMDLCRIFILCICVMLDMCTKNYIDKIR